MSDASTATLIRTLGWDDRRGTASIVLFILTEAMLFVALFFAYFYLGRDKPHWPMDEPPKLMLAFIMLAVLFSSSVVVEWAKRLLKDNREGTARWAIFGAILLGLGFFALQFFEYRNHLRTLKPTTDAYGSIFYTITSIHALHVATGLLMLGYLLVLPRMHATTRPPHRSFHNASLYWHFVGGIWVFIVALLYVLPNV